MSSTLSSKSLTPNSTNAQTIEPNRPFSNNSTSTNSVTSKVENPSTDPFEEFAPNWRPVAPIYTHGLVGSVTGYQHTAVVPHDCHEFPRRVRNWLLYQHRHSIQILPTTTVTQSDTRNNLKRNSSDPSNQSGQAFKRQKLELKGDERIEALKANLYPSSQSSFGCLSNPDIPPPGGFYAHRLAYEKQKRKTLSLMNSKIEPDSHPIDQALQHQSHLPDQPIQEKSRCRLN